jgi:hypothetical protein
MVVIDVVLITATLRTVGSALIFAADAMDKEAGK